VENQVSTVHATGGSAPAAASRTATRRAARRRASRRRRLLREALHGDVRRLVAVEREASNAVEFLLLAVGEIDERHLVLRRRRWRCSLRAGSAAATTTAAATSTTSAARACRRGRIHR